MSGGAADTTTKTDLAKQVNDATAAARSRISALATAQSYGGSQFGFGTSVPLALQSGGQQIGLASAERGNIAQTYGVEQQIQPLHYIMGPNAGLAGRRRQLARFGGGQGARLRCGAGGGLGSLFSGAGGAAGAGASAISGMSDVDLGAQILGLV